MSLDLEEVIPMTEKVTPPIPQRKNIWRRAISSMASVDLFAVLFAVFLAALGIVTSFRINNPLLLLLNCSVVIAMIFGILVLRAKTAKSWARLLHIFYVAPLVPIIFKSVEFLSYPLHHKDYDATLIAIDRALFGTDPTIWLSQHLPSLPAFTEYLQIVYSTFYILPVILGVELYRRRKEHIPFAEFSDKERDELEELRFIIVYGFFLSYIGYISYPAVGPRWTLHDFFAINHELPGLWFTESIRAALNAGENVKEGMTLLQARAAVTRDAFPSGHVDLTVITTLLAFKYNARVRWFLLVICLSMIFATVYLRYHYVIDVIGGLIFSLITLYTWEPLERWLLRLKRRMLNAVR